MIAIRDAAGQTLTEFRTEPGSQRVSRVKEYVTGAGQILVERAVSVGMVTHATQSPLSTAGNYSMALTSGTGASSYAVDIRTASGSSRLVTGIHPDAQGNYSIAESDLFPGEANFVRIRKDEGEPASYSPPATIVYDPSVNAQSPNLIRALSASRQGNAIILRWSFAASSTKKTRLYFARADGQGVVPLTANGLAAGVTTLSILGTALAAPCGSFYATQFVTGQPESTPSSSAPLPNQVSDFGAGGGYGGGTCEGPPPPPNPTPTLVYSDGFHHRDHLGSLRVVTDSGGWRVSGHDYYPFGSEIFATGGGDDGTGSRNRFTGHEREIDTSWDYLLGRSAVPAVGRFLSLDPVHAIGLGEPQSLNRYAYVSNSPLRFVDPDGLTLKEVNVTAEGKNRVPHGSPHPNGGVTPGQLLDLGYVVGGTSIQLFLNIRATFTTPDEASQYFIGQEIASFVRKNGALSTLPTEEVLDPEDHQVDGQSLYAFDGPGDTTGAQPALGVESSQVHLAEVFISRRDDPKQKQKTETWYAVVIVKKRGERGSGRLINLTKDQVERLLAILRTKGSLTVEDVESVAGKL